VRVVCLCVWHIKCENLLMWEMRGKLNLNSHFYLKLWEVCSSHPPVFFSTPRVSLNAPKKKGRTTRAVFLHKFSTPYVEKWYVEKRTDRKIHTFSFKNFEFSGIILGFRGWKRVRGVRRAIFDFYSH
jgi:hypothetical protein